MYDYEYRIMLTGIVRADSEDDAEELLQQLKFQFANVTVCELHLADWEDEVSDA